MIDLERIRTDLPSTVENAYLNAGTFGPLPRPAAAAMQAHLAEALELGRIGTRGYANWDGFTEAARDGFARAAGSPPGEIALMHSTTEGCNTVVAGLDFEPGDEVVTTSHEHPGLTEPLHELARRHGVVVRVVEPDRGSIAAALGPRTRLVAISHVLWTTGEVLPVADISDDAHAAGALVLVDGAQGGGAVPFRAADLRCDFYTYSGQKWLLGPSGTGALWVAPASLDRLATPWPWYLSRDRRSGPEVQDWPDARRLDAGTVTLTAMTGIAAAIAWHRDVGGDDGLRHAATLAASLRGLLEDARGIEVVACAAPSTLVAFRTPGREPAQVVADLEERGVLVRQVPSAGVVRASVGFWNDERDLDRLVSGVSA